MKPLTLTNLASESLTSLDESGMLEIPMTPSTATRSFSPRSFKASQFKQQQQKSSLGLHPNGSSPTLSSPVSSESNARSLGIKRRPSESILSTKANGNTQMSQIVRTPRLAAMSRPVSSESSSDSSEDCTESRVSSITSISSTDMKSLQANLHRDSTPNSIINSYQAKLATSQKLQQQGYKSTPNLSTRTSSSNTLNSSTSTISSDFRKSLPLRRYSTKTLSKTEKQKRYEELKEDDDIPLDETMFNVPMALPSTASLFSQSSFNKSSDILKKGWNEDQGTNILPSPLPGKLQFFGHPGDNPNQANLKRNSSASTASSHIPSPISKHTSFSSLSPMAQQLSTFYEFSIQNNVDEELTKRSHQIPTNHIYLDQSMEDLKLVSSEKLDELSMTRPSWLPPKDKLECKKQEREFKKMIELQGKQLKKQNLARDERDRSRMVGDARLLYLSNKASLSSSNALEIKKLLWRSLVEPNVRFSLFTKVLKYRGNLDDDKLKCPVIKSTNLKIDVQSYVSLNSELFDNPKLVTALSNLLKTTTTMSGWKFNSFNIASCLVINNFNSTLALNTLYYLNQFVINETFINKFNNNLNRNRIVKAYLKDFRDDMIAINFDSFVKLLNSFKPSVLFKLISLLIVYGDYKLLYGFILTIILHYHFGWNNIQLVLSGAKDNLIRIDDEELFWSRVYGYYKKF